MGAYTYTLPEDVVDGGSAVILPAGNYRIQDSQITLIDGKEIHILLTRINLGTFSVDNISFIVSANDLKSMSNSITTGKSFSEELDILIWGWVFAKEKAVALLGREALADEVLPSTTKVT